MFVLILVFFFFRLVYALRVGFGGILRELLVCVVSLAVVFWVWVCRLILISGCLNVGFVGLILDEFVLVLGLPVIVEVVFVVRQTCCRF